VVLFDGVSFIPRTSVCAGRTTADSSDFTSKSRVFLDTPEGQDIIINVGGEVPRDQYKGWSPTKGSTTEFCPLARD
jgi:hypothetical protein